MPDIDVVPPEPLGSRPKVSVILTTYNHEQFIAQALDGALRQQTSFPYEVVVGEDCSTDDTRAIIERYQRRHPDSVRLVLPSTNLGPNRMYLEVMRLARGEYFAVLDGDDYWESTDKLERQATFLDANPDVAACFHDMTVRTADSSVSRPALPELPRRQFTLDDILAGNFVPTSSVVHRRVDLSALPSWFTNFYWIDWLLLILCAQRGVLVDIGDLRATRRVHANGLWSARDREAQILEELVVYEFLLTALRADVHGAIRAGRRRCRVQLAVEQAGLSFGVRIAVVSRPPFLPWYFNGRTTLQVPVDDPPSDAATMAALIRLRRLPPAAPATPHWRSATRPATAGHDCLFVVVPAPVERQAQLPQVMKHLRQHHCVHADHDCAIYRLELLQVDERRVTRIDPSVGGTLRGHLDRPQFGAVTSGATLEVIGWALPKTGRVHEVRIRYGDRVLQRTSLGVQRPDLASAFPQEVDACTAGFRTLADLTEIPSVARIDVEVLLDEGRHETLASVDVAPALAGESHE